MIMWITLEKLIKKLGIINEVIRITDKVNRLQSLCAKDALVDEFIKDTLIDLDNYSIMT
ncbi:nucleotide modification associated domain-containing protein [Clostridium sporogenes]|uniref:Nucleotide modification associated domain-containing protein n=1 Tax=Clostridium sporogenes TaxID=1509 RepID=A0AAE4FJ20_CLOSG|nr:nucleotide modification associated domain-containing protein [Clostridium sporogenes]